MNRASVEDQLETAVREINALKKELFERKTAPFVIINLANLRIISFRHEDDWRAAASTLFRRDVTFVPLRRDEKFGRYRVMELVH